MDTLTYKYESEMESANGLFETKYRLPSQATAIDLLPFLHGRMRTKRLRKKFLKNVGYYSKLLPESVYWEYVSKHLTKSMAGFIFDRLNTESFARKILPIIPILKDNVDET